MYNTHLQPFPTGFAARSGASFSLCESLNEPWRDSGCSWRPARPVPGSTDNRLGSCRLSAHPDELVLEITERRAAAADSQHVSDMPGHAVKAFQTRARVGSQYLHAQNYAPQSSTASLGATLSP
jgi:hypothetical protein